MSQHAEWLYRYVTTNKNDLEKKVTVDTIKAVLNVANASSYHTVVLNGSTLHVYSKDGTKRVFTASVSSGTINLKSETTDAVFSLSKEGTEAKPKGVSFNFDDGVFDGTDYVIVLPPKPLNGVLKLLPGAPVRVLHGLGGFANGAVFMKASAFALSAHITSVTATNKTYTLDLGVFMHCVNIEHVALRAASIPTMAFLGCTRLTTVSLIDVKLLGERCFARCTALQDVVWCTEMKTIGERAFDGCTSLCSTPDCSQVDVGADTFCDTRVANRVLKWPELQQPPTNFICGMAA